MRCVTDMAALDEFTENVRAVIRRLKKNGCSFFYHNHSIEFYRLPSGVTLFEYLLEKIPDLNITLDVHWVQRGGADVLRTIERCAGRLECVHLKDYAVNKARVAGENISLAPQRAINQIRDIPNRVATNVKNIPDNLRSRIVGSSRSRINIRNIGNNLLERWKNYFNNESERNS